MSNHKTIPEGDELSLFEALKRAIKVADEAREQWDKAPDGMRAGKLLIALSGFCRGYRADIDAIHAALADATVKAAAHDLLAACIAMKAEIDGLKWGQSYPGRPHAVMDAAEAAIAKATGARP